MLKYTYLPGALEEIPKGFYRSGTMHVITADPNPELESIVSDQLDALRYMTVRILNAIEFIDIKFNLSDVPTFNDKCVCPKENFLFTGIGCKCGGK